MSERHFGETPDDWASREIRQTAKDWSEPPAAPEIIHISQPALRAVVLGLIDDGRTKGQLNLPWFFYRSPSTADIAVRLGFCDELEKRLRQLPARG